MIKLTNDIITLAFENDNTNRRRIITIDKLTGDVKIVELVDDETVEEIRCDVFDLMSIKDMDKYNKTAAEFEDEE